MKNRKFLLVILLIMFLSFIYESELEASTSYHLTLGERTLRRGDEGADVAILQQKLQNMGIYTERIDGIYGSNTVKAVRSFQEKNTLTADGIAGPKTFASLPQEGQLM